MTYTLENNIYCIFIFNYIHIYIYLIIYSIDVCVCFYKIHVSMCHIYLSDKHSSLYVGFTVLGRPVHLNNVPSVPNYQLH